jgi:general secretion pathway protein D
MTRRISVFLLAIVFALSACAPGKGLLKGEEGVEAQLPEEEKKFVLPLPPPPKAVKKPPRAAPLRIEEIEDEKYIILNFENTDIQTIISTFGELMGINYILTPGITGNVTVQSYNKFPIADMFQIFQTLLEINGLTAVKEGSFYKIIPIDSAKQQPLEVGKGRLDEVHLDASFVTQLIPLENVKASETANILRNLMPRGTDLIVYEPANMLIVTAQPPTLAKFMKIIEALDLAEMESESIRTFVYYVENGKAETLEGILKTVYSEKKSSRGKTAAAPAVPQRRTRTTRTTSSQAQTLPGTLGEITVTAYEDINALIIKCSSRTYLSLLEVLKKIDVPPKQVLIEVLIAEIRLEDASQYGLQWLVKSDRGDTFGFTSANVENPPIITTEHPGSGSGIFSAVVSGLSGNAQYNYVISAAASATNIKVLASPHILVMDNQEAEIKTGKEIPTATSTTESTEGTTTSSQIEYKTVGTILTVTPHITEKGRVSMKLAIEKSDTGKSTTLGSGTYPDFTTNKATTYAVVDNGHTLIIAGLIEESKDKSRTGIPFLSRIPILGYLFGYSEDKTERNELIVMVTPHVISNQDEADELTRSFKNKVRTINKAIKEMDSQNKKYEEKEAGEDEEEEPGEEETPKEESLSEPSAENPDSPI